MTNSAANVAGAPTGSLYKAPTATTAPTGTAASLTSWTDLGYISDNGVTLSLPDSGDKTTLHAWQGNAIVRTYRSPTEDSPQIKAVLLETKKATVETYFGATVSQTGTEGTFDYVATALRGHDSYTLDVIDGSSIRRLYVPYGIITSVGDQQYTFGDLVGYEVTIDAELDPTLGISFRSWLTALHS